MRSIDRTGLRETSNAKIGKSQSISAKNIYLISGKAD